MKRKCAGWVLAVALMFVAGEADAKWHVQCLSDGGWDTEFFWYDSGASFDTKNQALRMAADICKNDRSSRVTWKMF